MDNAYLYSASLSLSLSRLPVTWMVKEKIFGGKYEVAFGTTLPLHRLTTCQNSNGGTLEGGDGGVEDKMIFFESDSPLRFYTPMIITLDNVSPSNLFTYFSPSFSVWIGCLIRYMACSFYRYLRTMHEVCSTSIYRLLHQLLYLASCLVSSRKFTFLKIFCFRFYHLFSS